MLQYKRFVSGKSGIIHEYVCSMYTKLESSCEMGFPNVHMQTVKLTQTAKLFLSGIRTPILGDVHGDIALASMESEQM